MDSAEPSQRLCDAMGEVACAALDTGLAQRAGKARTSSYQVLVHVDESVLRDDDQQGRCDVEGGVGVSAARRCFIPQGSDRTRGPARFDG